MEILGSVPVCLIREGAKVPVRASDGAIGYDVFASVVLDRQTKLPTAQLPVVIEPGGGVLIGIGVKMAIPGNFEIQVRPRSGLASKHDIELGNSPGTVDPDFRGEVGILLRNHGSKPFEIAQGMRIAQLIFSQVEKPELRVVADETDLSATRRGEGGFGSTGLIGLGLGTQDDDEAVRRIDCYHMGQVLAAAKWSNCIRGCVKGENGKYQRDHEGYLIGQTRRYGCVIARGLRAIATGFNAQYEGSKLCEELGCLRDERKIPSGQQIEICRAIHAEQMAINTAAREGIKIEGATMYVNAEPCLICAKIIAGTGILTLVALKGGYGETHGLSIVREAGIRVRELAMD